MNILKRLFNSGRNQRIVHGSLGFGIGLFGIVLFFCIVVSIFRPYNPYVSHSDLKNLAPSTSYLNVPNALSSEHVLDMQSGRAFGIALSDTNDLYSWGNIRIDSSMKTKKYQKIAAGFDHYVLLDDTGKLYDSTDGEIVPEIIASQSIKEIFAGDAVSAVLTNDQRLLIWGSRAKQFIIPEELQTHIVTADFSATHFVLVLDDGSVKILGNQGSALMDIPGELNNSRIHIVDAQISAQEVIALDDAGNVYVWGERFQTTQLEKQSGMIQIAASHDAVFALGDDHQLYVISDGTFHENEIVKDVYKNIFADQYQVYGVGEKQIQTWGNHGFPLGSDGYGRDVLSRLAHGGFVTMGIGLVACIVEAILGVIIGMWAGYRGGWVDHILMRICEMFASLPFLPLVITLSAFLKDRLDPISRIILIMILLGVLSAPNLARLIRSQILIEREKSYVEAAKLLGANTRWILRHELFPQIMHLLLVHFILSYADNMLVESALSFLGFGVQAPYPTWGNMLDGAQSTFILEHLWWQWFLPALCIFLCVLAINLIGEGLRQISTPKEGKAQRSYIK